MIDFKTQARQVIEKLLNSDSTHEARLDIISTALKDSFEFGLDLAAEYVESEVQGGYLGQEIKLLKKDFKHV